MPDLKKASSTLADSIIAVGRQTHGTIVMQLTAMLEYDLERCLVRKFRPLNRKLKKGLFEAYGPLSSFAAKIDLAFALDITTEATHKELHKMRKIRNAFALPKRVELGHRASQDNVLHAGSSRWHYRELSRPVCEVRSGD